MLLPRLLPQQGLAEQGETAQAASSHQASPGPLVVADDYPDVVPLFQELSRSISQPDPVPEGGDIRIMSVHASKGLTADAVFVLGCIEGLLPRHEDGLTPEEEAAHYEEQRRLFYVALTRTKRILFLSYPYAMMPGLAARTGVVVQDQLVRVRGQWCGRTHASRYLMQMGEAAPKPAAGDQVLAAFFQRHQAAAAAR